MAALSLEVEDCVEARTDMTHGEIEDLVKAQYATFYPKWEVMGVEAAHYRFFGDVLFVVNAKNEDGVEVQDICKIDGAFVNVVIFASQRDFARYVEEKSLTPLWDRIFTTKILSGVLFTMLLIFIFCAGFYKDRFDPQALSILGSVVGVAAGFYFGSNRNER